MPTYEYACKQCGEHLEVVQSFRDDPLTECPTCEGQLRKVFSAAGLIFKGSGWHIKDYSSSSRTGASPGESSGSKDAGGSKDSGGTKDAGGAKDSSGSKESGGSGAKESKPAGSASGSGGASGSKSSDGSSSGAKKSA